MLSEFQLIARYFKRSPRAGGPVQLGVGDDCALLQPPSGELLAVSTDMLIEGRHFFAGTNPYDLGHKALAVNLSDLAAMGAQPISFTLALALPASDPHWLQAFSEGLFRLADAQGIELMGGDTTRGPLTISITVIGSVPNTKALKRSGAQAGDELWVSGTLGDARLALEVLQNKRTLAPDLLTKASERLHRPVPRVALGLALRGIASAAIDVSDGLLGDLGHLLNQSSLSATLLADDLPFGEALGSQTIDTRYELALNGGDDYELIFSAAPDQHQAVIDAGHRSHTQVTCIGRLSKGSGIHVQDQQGNLISATNHSFDHFTENSTT
jgi:thiamine-monophosphate kinase